MSLYPKRIGVFSERSLTKCMLGLAPKLKTFACWSPIGPSIIHCMVKGRKLSRK